MASRPWAMARLSCGALPSRAQDRLDHFEDHPPDALGVAEHVAQPRPRGQLGDRQVPRHVAGRVAAVGRRRLARRHRTPQRMRDRGPSRRDARAIAQERDRLQAVGRGDEIG